MISSRAACDASEEDDGCEEISIHESALGERMSHAHLQDAYLQSEIFLYFDGIVLACLDDPVTKSVAYRVFQSQKAQGWLASWRSCLRRLPINQSSSVELTAL